jgi:hypothetical protein
LLRDAGANHDPVLVEAMTATGSGSVVLELGLEAFGLDPDLWTPAGFVCGPDEILAQDGVAFGASVSNNSIQIFGGYPASGTRVRNRVIYYDGANWIDTSGGGTQIYTFNWATSGADAYLEVTRATGYEVDSGTTSWMHGVVKLDNANATTGFTIENGQAITQGMRFRFREFDGTIITSPSTRLQFYIYDPAAPAVASTYNFESPVPDAASNIWFVGIFRRKPSTY